VAPRARRWRSWPSAPRASAPTGSLAGELLARGQSGAWFPRIARLSARARRCPWRHGCRTGRPGPPPRPVHGGQAAFANAARRRGFAVLTDAHEALHHAVVHAAARPRDRGRPRRSRRRIAALPHPAAARLRRHNPSRRTRRTPRRPRTRRRPRSPPSTRRSIHANAPVSNALKPHQHSVPDDHLPSSPTTAGGD
jgi:hypothetical protein